MEFLSLFSGIDSLRKFLVMLGLTLISLGFIYPTQKKVEYEDKKIQLKEDRQLLSLELDRIEATIDALEVEVDKHSIRAQQLRNDQKKFSNNSEDYDRIEQEIKLLRDSDLEKNRLQNDNIFEFEKRQVKYNSLNDSISVMGRTICWLVTFQITAIVLGGFLLWFGFRNWNKSEKNSFEIVETELGLKKEELKKLKKSNK